MIRPGMIFQLFAVILLIGYCGRGDIANADQWCKDHPDASCQPQCVGWARKNSDVKICGHAKDWPANANKYGCELTDTPKKGRVIVIDFSSYGHVVAVQDSDKKDDGKYSLRITHSNYDWKCNTESNIKATYDKKKRTIKFRDGKWDGKELPVIAIIKRK